MIISGHTSQQPSSNPNVVSSQQEEDDIAKAIQLSLADSKTPSSQKARPSSSAQQQQQQALYPTAAEFLAQTSSYQVCSMLTIFFSGNFWLQLNNFFAKIEFHLGILATKLGTHTQEPWNP